MLRIIGLIFRCRWLGGSANTPGTPAIQHDATVGTGSGQSSTANNRVALASPITGLAMMSLILRLSVYILSTLDPALLAFEPVRFRALRVLGEHRWQLEGRHSVGIDLWIRGDRVEAEAT